MTKNIPVNIPFINIPVSPIYQSSAYLAFTYICSKAVRKKKLL